MQSTFPSWLTAQAQRVQVFLQQQLSPATPADPALYEAMRYAVLGGGKRVRAGLVYAAVQTVAPAQVASTDEQQALAHAANCVAGAVELIHAYSLVHDDLPSMDNDDWRRGQPTCHKRFGQAMAILAGDALQPLAFSLLAQLPSEHIGQAVALLSQASGAEGMVSGQSLDIALVNQALDLPALQHMHYLKTGAMIHASVALGALVAKASAEQYQALSQYGRCIGLAFQIVDDILDATASSETLGKTAGKDAQHNKPTYVTLLGLAQAQQHAQSLHTQAHAALASLGTSAQALRDLADFILDRQH